VITLEKLKTYEAFGGDMDGWARLSKRQDPAGMTDADWHLIDELLLGLTAVVSGLASPSYGRDVETRVWASTADEATRTALRALAARRSPCNGGAP
jgi:hypothetical protein